MFYPGTVVFKIMAHLIPYCYLKNYVVEGGTLRWLKGTQGPLGGQRWIKGGPMFSSGLEVFRITITLDASMTLLKSGCLREHLKMV